MPVSLVRAPALATHRILLSTTFGGAPALRKPFITGRNFFTGKLWSARPPTLATNRILLSIMFGGAAALRKSFHYRAKFIHRETLVGAPARPRNPPYTTFYYVRRRSCSAKIFSSQAESFYPEALVGTSAVPTRASLAFDSMSAPCVGTLAPCRGADSPIRCGYLSLCCFRCSPRLLHRERYGGCTSSLHDAGPFTRSHSTREACHMRRQPVAS